MYRQWPSLAQYRVCLTIARRTVCFALKIRELETKLDELEERIKILLLPTDPNDNRNVMLEIRAGTGGDEAAIWAGELLGVYRKYATEQASLEKGMGYCSVGHSSRSEQGFGPLLLVEKLLREVAWDEEIYPYSRIFVLDASVTSQEIRQQRRPSVTRFLEQIPVVLKNYRRRSGS